jgi:hypothetical protein
MKVSINFNKNRDMKVKQKRFQYWGSIDGIPQIMWSDWFDYNGPEEPIQLKGFKGNHLKNEYRTITR